MITKIFFHIFSYIYLKLRGGVAHARWCGVTVGERCRIFSNEYGSEPFLIEIGNDVTISTKVIFVTHDGSLSLIKDHNGRRFKFSPIKIGNNVFIGSGSIVMPGVTIENNVVVGAGTIVTKSLKSNAVYVGNPARKIKSFDDFYLEKILLDPLPNKTSRESYKQWVLRCVKK